jgi:hypothetical protein
MSTMTVERLHNLFDNNPEKDFLAWEGSCHDCKQEVTVTAKPEEDGIHIEGGSIYEPIPDKFYLKCDSCYRKDATLTNFRGCEVYSRVVGYLRPVGQWNDAKQAEFSDRKTFAV